MRRLNWLGVVEVPSLTLQWIYGAIARLMVVGKVTS